MLVSHLHKVADDAYWLTLGPTKTDQGGDADDSTRSKPLTGRPAIAVKSGSRASGIQGRTSVPDEFGEAAVSGRHCPARPSLKSSSAALSSLA